MSLYSRLVDKINEETSGGMVGPMTTSGNPSVAYLPGGFTTMRNYLRSLNPIKKQWKLEVLEDKEKGNYTVKIEDALNIVIPKQHYQHFNENVYDIINNKTLDLKAIINEGTEEQVEVAVERIEDLLNKFKENPRVIQSIVLMNQWVYQFSNSRYSHNHNSLINLNTFDRSVNLLISRLKNIYKSDLGTLEQILNTLEEGQALNAFKPFSSHKSFIGVTILSTYNNVDLVLQMTLDLNMIPNQHVSVSSKELAAELEAYKSVKVESQEIYPVGQMFPAVFFKTLKQSIDETENS